MNVALFAIYNFDTKTKWLGEEGHTAKQKNHGNGPHNAVVEVKYFSFDLLTPRNIDIK